MRSHKLNPYILKWKNGNRKTFQLVYIYDFLRQNTNRQREEHFKIKIYCLDGWSIIVILVYQVLYDFKIEIKATKKFEL